MLIPLPRVCGKALADNSHKESYAIESLELKLIDYNFMRINFLLHIYIYLCKLHVYSYTLPLFKERRRTYTDTIITIILKRTQGYRDIDFILL